MRRIIITLTAAVLLAFVFAGTAQATTIIDKDPQWKPWAMTWEKKAVQARAELLGTARVTLGLRLRILPLPDRMTFVVWYPTRAGQKPIGAMHWKRYGTACKERALSWFRAAEVLRVEAVR